MKLTLISSDIGAQVWVWSPKKVVGEQSRFPGVARLKVLLVPRAVALALLLVARQCIIVHSARAEGRRGAILEHRGPLMHCVIRRDDEHL